MTELSNIQSVGLDQYENGITRSSSGRTTYAPDGVTNPSVIDPTVIEADERPYRPSAISNIYHVPRRVASLSERQRWTPVGRPPHLRQEQSTHSSRSSFNLAERRPPDSLYRVGASAAEPALVPRSRTPSFPRHHSDQEPRLARRTSSRTRYHVERIPSDRTVSSDGWPNVENVVVPAHLLRTVHNTSERLWQPDQGDLTRGSISDAPFIQQVVHTQQREAERIRQRAASVTIGGIGRSRAIGVDSRANPFAVASSRPPLRKTSLPTVRESYPAALAPAIAPPQGVQRTTSPAHQRPRAGSRHSSGNSQRAQPGLTYLFQNLENFTFDHSRRRSEDSELSFSSSNADPMFVMSGDDMRPIAKEVTWGAREEAIAREDRRGTITSVIQDVANTVAQTVRRSSLYDVYEKAKVRGQRLQRKKWAQVLFEYTIYTILLAFVYFVLVGVPLWKGAVYWLWWVVQHKFVVPGGFSITVGLAAFYAFSPLFILFEKDPPTPEYPPGFDLRNAQGVADTALLIPCYKSAGLIANTLESALKIFPPSHIFVIANGNSPTPLDNTEEVCRPYGVNHIWSPVGSKIVAQFVGCYAAKQFKNVLLIDDDCALPPNFPVVSDRMKGKIKCIGYTIKSVGPNSSRGTLCQQAQDLEYKISGLQRALAGKIGSATFPHGAISLWDTKFLISTFHEHPGFSVSEDWFFGHVARKLGCQITMCTSIFVETETPSAVFFSSGGSRGGFGEMTIFKQRFMRWNFFFVNGMWYNMAYILSSWRLGWWELGAKIFVFQEVYETLLYLLTPFILPISFIVRPDFCGYLLIGTIVMYLVNVIIFNEIHLRLKKERVGSVAVYLYYMPYKVVLTFINVTSCYWSLYKYARYFARRHPKIIEDEKALEVVLRLEEHAPVQEKDEEGGRRMTVTAIGTRLSIASAASGEQQNQQGGLETIGEDIPFDGQTMQRSSLTQHDQTVETVDFAAHPAVRPSISSIRSRERSGLNTIGEGVPLERAISRTSSPSPGVATVDFAAHPAVRLSAASTLVPESPTGRRSPRVVGEGLSPDGQLARRLSLVSEDQVSETMEIPTPPAAVLSRSTSQRTVSSHASSRRAARLNRWIPRGFLAGEAQEVRTPLEMQETQSVTADYFSSSNERRKTSLAQSMV